MDQQEIRVYNSVCTHNTITGILMRYGPVQFGPVLHARLYLVLVLYYSSTRACLARYML